MIRLAPRFRLYRDRYRRFYYGLVTFSILTLIMYIYLVFNVTDPSEENFVSYSLQDLDSETQHTFYKGCADINSYLNDQSYRKSNASFIMLARNEELSDILTTLYSIESHFNQWYHYPYVFLNDEPFTEEFKEKVRQSVTGSVQFGTLNELEWEFPVEVRETMEFTERIKDQSDRGVLYGDVESYHKMCRFYSGLFYKHPMVRAYDWYWRIEPDVSFFCDITYDPFFEMEKNGKEYGFTVVLQELYWSVPGLFRATRSYINKNNIRLGSLWKLFAGTFDYARTGDEYLHKTVFDEKLLKEKLEEKINIDHLLDKTQNGDVDLNDKGNLRGLNHLLNRAQSKVPIFEDKFDNEVFDLCHFWSNFEIAKRTVFDNPIYDGYFKHLESLGGFWKERWGDAPVHSLGLALTLDIEQIHYFRDIGYKHSTLVHCPKNAPQEFQLPYFAGDDKFSNRNAKQYDPPFNLGSGCRCECPSIHLEIEDTSYPCMDFWLELAHGMEENTNFGDGGYYPYVDLDQREEEMKEEYEFNS
ncbi:similar to Saccharomyces cerevisiae YIL085C KTR7 Putative mannosyltransferase involved in protein glycosylation [Maudiozyma barnettii]|uniref:Similar to Saccharomyces cerevisiae YIL085C KTR7 Putative mannosyltransferase involved in protein glycosylation n=1 Tax=Maudiozyma barnettii TaxID=61262 RepID=A0A8H2VKL6_9SACH|nr:putative mannosyltransferase [Kazachstania barnettii]CAB4257054.1 similar to Saccharomyces cerevisiae YIL085C KTR7 Putative mannosyltransferase involved in protein glycosylation [Kazachstania barnettii]CAD1779425.1 similar to Saccharomyces cerevisiae YIL085C KTR7 Putative mannosyltransferase involved in protein glycosylation [Kazachstania barnettii]